jgi:hypothetical protein
VQKKAKRTDKQKLLFDALAEALADVGTSPPATERIPAKVKNVVTIKKWREYTYRRHISDGTELARDKAFERAVERLDVLKRVGIWEGNAWIPPI